MRRCPRSSLRCAVRPRASRVGLFGVAPRTLSAAFIALFLLFGQGVSLFHLLLVPHATCEHGELIELHETPCAAPAEGPKKQVSVRATAPGGGEHEHCTESARLHRLASLGPSIAEASLLSIAPRASLRESRETRPVALLSLAPKSSPPVL